MITVVNAIQIGKRHSFGLALDRTMKVLKKLSARFAIAQLHQNFTPCVSIRKPLNKKVPTIGQKQLYVTKITTCKTSK